ncbi:MAG: hypothetical protein LAP39_25695 [Acidobacteriia bacterium]|nr:hypothetical protein [Terriglobia bacterium]
MMGISLRAYARMRGCSLTAVQKAIASKRISTLPDGTIDPERANQDWEKNTFAGQTINRAQSALPPVHESPAASGDPVTAYLRARAVSETFKAKTAQLEYEERAGKLIQATKAGEYAAHWSAIVGDALAAFADRAAPLVAAAKTEAEIHRILAGETNALRRKMSKAISDAGY